MGSRCPPEPRSYGPSCSSCGFEIDSWTMLLDVFGLREAVWTLDWHENVLLVKRMSQKRLQMWTSTRESCLNPIDKAVLDINSSFRFISHVTAGFSRPFWGSGHQKSSDCAVETLGQGARSDPAGAERPAAEFVIARDVEAVDHVRFKIVLSHVFHLRS